MPEGTGERRPYIMPQLLRRYAYGGVHGLGIRDLGTDGVSGLSKPAQWEDPIISMKGSKQTQIPSPHLHRWWGEGTGGEFFCDV